MITVSIMAATVMQTLDSTIANVALPHMQGALSASQDQIAWVLTAYIVAAAIATPLTGWMVDRFGQKRVFLASVIGFTVASALCGLADSLGQIVSARLLQGVFGAALVPMSQMVLMEINPPAKQGPAMAVWGMGVMVGPILGPTLGGWLTDSYDWRWVFFINIPVGALATYGIWRFIHPVPAARRMRFDLFGFTALSLAVGALQMLLDRGEQNDWFSSNETWVEAIVMAVAFCYFIAHTALTRADRSFLDYRLLKNGNYVSGLTFIFIVGLVMYATRALLPTMLENLLDYPVTTTGLVTAPSGIGTMAAMMLAGRIMGRVDLRLLLLAGFSITAFAALADDRLLARHFRERCDLARRHPGDRPGFRVRPLERRDLRHLESRDARPGHRDFQPGAKHRVEHRHLDGADPAGARHRQVACRTGGADHACQPCMERCVRGLGL